MKKLILITLLLTGCYSEPFPGSFNGTVVEIRKNMYYDTVNCVKVFSQDFGIVNIYDTPYIDLIKYNDNVTIGCTYLNFANKKAEDCKIINKVKK